MSKILIVSLEYPPQVGGIASYVQNFAAHLPLESVVIYAPKIKGDYDYDVKNPWKVYRRSPYWFLWPRWLRMLWQLNIIIKKEKIEKIYIQHALPVGYVAYLIKKIKKIPYIVFFHGTDLTLGLTKKVHKLSLVCRSAEQVIVSSNFLKTKLLSKLDDLKNVKVINPCPGDLFLQPINQEEVDKIKSQLALSGKKVIISVSRLADGKGFPHLIRVMPDILRKVPNLVWLIVGDGPKREAIVNLVQQYKLQNVVRFIGQINYEELPKFYHLADLFVLLTHKDETTEEGWGTVFLEAAACGLPVVAGKVGGVDETIEHSRTGILVDIYQGANVAASIADILLDEDFAGQMGLAGRERVLNEFTWEKQIAKIG
ncbi:MAG: hypothetical protein COU29_00070 [Candidatus Magasanikbacteria bacterium CG10_big_fil_rev_8_21_14_0_10_36_32]|uniref:Glycosyltransferase family 4 protein n=1 Tax=Candidatus Magasanikbacteria bacterium CG10_big_fil_rev_8_21_14_0_10_36_32 TaxID=1974646 RepID=A0A2M6W7K4_9BACT|nr:MAG: hypothetical protein COU29_00070 [Candidatus Magasanikbacteria bacterium CG10_big_fil_rev_8_21_14_0_10_36_32]